MLKSDVASGPSYHVQAFRTAQCRVKGRYAYRTYAKDRDHLYYVYVFVIRGNGITALVDTGMESVEEMNRGAGFLMAELVSQQPGEDVASILDREAIAADRLDHVLLTHCHYDHCSQLSMFPRAQVAVPQHAWDVWHSTPDGAVYLHEGFLDELTSIREQGRLLLLDKGLVAPGIGIWMDDGECRRALEIARDEPDILVPGHDPLVLDKHPGGVVGSGKWPLD